MFAPMVCLLLALNEGSASATVLRSYDLAAVIGPRGRAVAIETLPLRPTYDHMPELDFDEWDGFTADLLVSLIVENVHPDEWEYAGRSIDVRGEEPGVLTIEAPAATQQEVERFLAYVASTVRRTVQLRVDVYRASPGGEFDALIGDLGPQGRKMLSDRVGGLLSTVGSFALPLVSGTPHSILSVERKLFVRDFDVEIAQAATAHQPVTDTYAVGVSGAIRADAGTADSARVTFAMNNTWESSPRTPVMAFASATYAVERMGAESRSAGGRVESPTLHFVTIAGSCSLEVGHTKTVFATAAPQGGAEAAATLFAFTLESVDPAPEPFALERRELLIQDVGAVASRGFRVGRFGIDALRFPRGRYEDMDDQLPLGLMVTSSDSTSQDAIELAMDALWSRDEETVTLQTAGRFVTISSRGGEATGLLAEIMERLPAPTGAAGVVATAGPAGWPLFATHAVADDALVVAGVSETYILDNDVDVANDISSFNPNVEAIVSGYAARLHASRGIQGQTHIEAFLTSQLRGGGRNEIDIESRDATHLHQPSFVCSALEASGAITRPGRLFGQLAIPGRPGSVAIKLRSDAR